MKNKQASFTQRLESLPLWAKVAVPCAVAGVVVLILIFANGAVGGAGPGDEHDASPDGGVLEEGTGQVSGSGDEQEEQAAEGEQGSGALDEGGLVWAVAPTLAYDRIVYIDVRDEEPEFVAYVDPGGYPMLVLDVKTGEPVRETGGRGVAFRYQYGYNAETDMFFIFDDQGYFSIDKDVVIQESMDTTNSVHEIYEIYDAKEYAYEGVVYTRMDWDDVDAGFNDGKAVYGNGRFVSDFIYDDVIGGNSIAFVGSGGKYAFADIEGVLLTDFVYDEVASVAKKYVAVRKGEAWGFVDMDGREALPFSFEHVENIDENTAFAKYRGLYGILDVAASAGEGR